MLKSYNQCLEQPSQFFPAFFLKKNFFIKKKIAKPKIINADMV